MRTDRREKMQGRKVRETPHQKPGPWVLLLHLVAGYSCAAKQCFTGLCSVANRGMLETQAEMGKVVSGLKSPAFRIR